MSQASDDPNGLNEALDEPPKTISKPAFEGLVFLGLLLLTFSEILVAQAVSRTLGFRIEGYWIGGSTMLNLILARVAVDGLLKRLGLSRSGRTLELQGRAVPFTEGEYPDWQSVEVRYSRSFITGLGVFCLAICLGISLVLATSPPARINGFWSACALVAVFGLGAAWCLYGMLWGNPQARADASGITGYPFGPHVRRRFVPWSEVATCEIETLYNTLGKPVLIRPTLRDCNGEVLMTLMLTYTKIEDQERLMKFIKAKLPKTKDDSWE